MVVHLPGEFSRGKGQRSNGGVAGEGRRQKFWRRSLYPSDDDTTVLRPALRVRTDREMASPGEQDAHTRHGESGASGTVAASAAVDLDVRHQTLAVRPETAPRVRRSPAGAQQLPWRSVARRLDSAAGQEPKGSIALPLVMVQPLFAKPLRSKTEMRNEPVVCRKAQ